MNYCIPDVYEMPHMGMGGYGVPGGGEHCMYAGEGPVYGQCEPQRLHHPPCMEPTWPPPPGQHYSCSYSAGPPVFKNEYCGVEIPLGHFHHQPEYFPDIKSDISHLQWMQGAHKRGTLTGSRHISLRFSFEPHSVLDMLMMSQYFFNLITNTGT